VADGRLFRREPDAASVELVRSLVPSATGTEPLLERIADADWVTLSQAFLEPIHAGRFFVHTARTPTPCPPARLRSGSRPGAHSAPAIMRRPPAAC
jgi:ribosomal protein L11 methyltransferase